MPEGQCSAIAAAVAGSSTSTRSGRSARSGFAALLLGWPVIISPTSSCSCDAWPTAACAALTASAECLAAAESLPRAVSAATAAALCSADCTAAAAELMLAFARAWGEARASLMRSTSQHSRSTYKARGDSTMLERNCRQPGVWRPFGELVVGAGTACCHMLCTQSSQQQAQGHVTRACMRTSMHCMHT